MAATPAPAAPSPAGMFSAPLARPKRDFDWASLLQGVGAGLLTGSNVGEGLGQGLILARQFADQRADNERYDRRDQREEEKYQYQLSKDQQATTQAAEAKAARDAAIDQLPIDDSVKAALKASDTMPSYGDLVPKAEGPQSGLAKLKADLDAGRIDKATYDAAVRKENYIAPRDGPDSWSPYVDPVTGRTGQKSRNTGKIDWDPGNSMLAQVGTDAQGNPIFDFVQGSGKPLTEGQSTGTLQFSLAQQANDTLGNADSVLTSAPDAIAAQFGTVGNYFKSDAYQKAEQAATVMSEQYLRALTGAAAPDAEVARTARSILPQPGDGPDVIAQKRATRLAIIEALRIKSGPGASQIQQPPAPEPRSKDDQAPATVIDGYTIRPK